MKGRKKWLGLLLLLFTIFGCSLSVSSNVFAEAVTTNSFGILWGDTGANWHLTRGIYYGYSNGVTFSNGLYGRVQEYDWLTPVMSLQGTTASIHFETNIVASFIGAPHYNPFTNLEYLTVKSCGSRTINTQSVSTAVTYWQGTNPNGARTYNYTLTVYGDVSVNGFNAGSTDDVRCTVSGGDYSFFIVQSVQPGQYNGIQFWFEQNPMSFYWSNSIDNSLLQTQVNQNNTIINQNQQIIDQNNQDRENLQNQSSDASDSADSAGAQVTAGIQPVLVSIGTFIQILKSPPSDNCVIDADMGHMDLGNIDLCQLSLPPAVATIATLLVVGIVVPLLFVTVRKLVNLILEAVR